jgi:hypothetical protein
MNKFEQLIEYVINDEEAKAKELFHEIVVEKSRQIYEEMMKDEELEEAAEADLEEGMALGGDQADDYIRDVEMEEQGMSEDEESDVEFDDTAEKDGEELTHDMEDDHDESGLEDRVVDLEDKLDELMSEFEALMGDEAGEEAGMDMAMDTPDMDSEEVVDDELETESMRMPMEEAISLKAAPAPVKSEDAGINKKSTVAANAGARGAIAKPVHTTGETAQGRPAPSTKDLIGKVQNTPAQGSVKQTPATKPHLAQATGVNSKSVIQ